jgi:HD-GYP domain-containing protein (c-di-GMP phosphodiesterase class II)
LHDIGKISIPAEILAKPARLSAAEFEIIKLHAEHGLGILNVVEFPWPVAQIAHQHHERLDGSGYPQGLKNGAILPEARILAVADVIEAMASHRPYRASLGVEPALEEIERGAGLRYDADVAASALRLFRDDRYRIPA